MSTLPLTPVNKAGPEIPCDEFGPLDISLKAGGYNAYEAAQEKRRAARDADRLKEKLKAITFVESGQMTVAEVARLMNRTRQQVQTWVIYKGDAREKYLKKLWDSKQ